MKFQICKIMPPQDNQRFHEDQWVKEEQQWDNDNPPFVGFSQKREKGFPIIPILVIVLFVFYLIAVWT